MSSAPPFALLPGSDILPQLRALRPNRPLSGIEARAVAERQAGLLLDLMHISEPPVPQFVICSLPGVLVEWRSGWPLAGTSINTGTRWHVVISADDPRQRQRFSLAHELKHILDAPFVDAPAGPEPMIDDPATRRLCDYFAACLLMPRPWIKHDFYGGIQKPYPLARRYYVSVEAMQTRLSELGLITTRPQGLGVRHRSAA